MKRGTKITICAWVMATMLFEGNLSYQYNKEVTSNRNITSAQTKVFEARQKELLAKDLLLKDREKVLNDCQKSIDEQYLKLDKQKELLKGLQGLSVVTDIPKETYQYLITVAKENSYNPELLFALIQHESVWDTKMVSPTHDYGICQINRGNFQDYSKRLRSKYSSFNIFDVKTNIDCMILNLNDTRETYRAQYKKDPSIYTLLYAYNTGATKQNISRGGSVYADKVVGFMNDYKEMINYVSEMSTL